MPDVDQLSIKINASAKSAHTSMSNLIKKLEKLQNTLSGLDVSAVTTQLGELSNIDFSNLDKVSNMRLPRGGSGSVGGGRASIGHMSGAIKSLGRSFNHMRSGLTSTTRGLAGFAKNLTTSHISVRGLASSLMHVYFRLFMIRRLLSGFKTAITKSMDMIETYHYFDVAMGKIGEESKDNFAKYGYDSADAYIKSFRDRSLQLTEQMSGYTFDANGNYKSNGLKNLGLDADTIMQYQAQYGQMANSIGMSGEAALATSKALTMLATDWASLRNIDFDTAFQKMASGLAGQSRAVRALGIDITQASLQQTAYNLGITTSISKMDQAAKAELRMITILDQSRVAWGDLAETLNTPANQFRMLQQNAVSLARALGNIFLPIVSKVLPYINALVIALRWLFEQIAGLLGIQTSGASGGIGGLSEEFADLGEDASDSLGNIADGANGANSSMEKLKRTVLSFDELNILNDPNSGSSNSGSGSGGTTGLSPAEMGALDSSLIGLLDEYQRVWDEAFGKMGNKAQELANKITGVFKTIWDYVQKRDWRGLGQYFASGINIGLDAVYGKIKIIGPKITEWVGNFANILNGMVDGVNWVRIGELVSTGLNTVSGTINAWFDTFDFNNFGSKVGLALLRALNTVNWTSVGQLFVNKFNALMSFINGVVTTPGIWDSLGSSMAQLLNGALGSINLEEAINTLAVSFNGLFESLRRFITDFHWDELKNKLIWSINAFIRKVDIAEAVDTLAFLFGKVLGTIADVIAGLDLVTLGGKLADAINKIVTNPDISLAKAKLRIAFKNVLKGIREAVDKVDWEGIGRAIGEWLEAVPWLDIFQTLIKVIKEAVLGIWEGLGDTFAGWIIRGFILFKGFGLLSGFVGNLAQWFMVPGSTTQATLGNAGNSLFRTLITKGVDKIKPALSILLKPLAAFIAGALVNEALTVEIGTDSDLFTTTDLFNDLMTSIEKLGEKSDLSSGQLDNFNRELSNMITEAMANGDASPAELIENIAQQLHNAGITATEFKDAIGDGNMTYALENLYGQLTLIEGKNFSDWKIKATEAFNSFKSVATESSDGVKRTVSNVINTIVGLVNPDRDSPFHRAIDDTKKGFKKIQESATDTADDTKTEFETKIGEMSTGVGNILDQTAKTAPTFFEGAGQNIANQFMGTDSLIANAIGLNNSGLYNVGRDATNALNTGIASVPIKVPKLNVGWHRVEYGPPDRRAWFDMPTMSYATEYARGGSPNAGELFWMNENNNPELMYKKGGRTHIDSNTEIVNSLKEAVIDGMMEVAMATSGQQNNSGGNTTFEVVLQCDSETLFRTVQKGRQKLINRGFRVESAY